MKRVAYGEPNKPRPVEIGRAFFIVFWVQSETADGFFPETVDTVKRKASISVFHTQLAKDSQGMKLKNLPVKVWRGANIPAEVRGAINAEDLFNLGGVCGDKKAGDPMEHDNLKLVLTDDTVEITVFNRGIGLFMSEDERVRRIHRVLCKLDGSGKD
jgi:hypothetical protein